MVELDYATAILLILLIIKIKQLTGSYTKKTKARSVVVQHPKTFSSKKKKTNQFTQLLQTLIIIIKWPKLPRKINSGAQ